MKKNLFPMLLAAAAWIFPVKQVTTIDYDLQGALREHFTYKLTLFWSSGPDPLIATYYHWVDISFILPVLATLFLIYKVRLLKFGA